MYDESAQCVYTYSYACIVVIHAHISWRMYVHIMCTVVYK